MKFHSDCPEDEANQRPCVKTFHQQLQFKLQKMRNNKQKKHKGQRERQRSRSRSNSRHKHSKHKSKSRYEESDRRQKQRQRERGRQRQRSNSRDNLKKDKKDQKKQDKKKSTSPESEKGKQSYEDEYQKYFPKEKNIIQNKININMNINTNSQDMQPQVIMNFNNMFTPSHQFAQKDNYFGYGTGHQRPYLKDQPLRLTIENQINYKHARRLYVGNIPQNITDEYLLQWMYRALEATGGLLDPGNPITNLKIDEGKKHAFLELRSIEQTSSAFQLDGIFLWNRQLRIRRPTQYDKFPKVQGIREVPILNTSVLDKIGIEIISTQVDNGPNKLYLANLPNHLDEYNLIYSLELKKYGKLKSFNLVKDPISNESKGYAFFEYQNFDHATLCINSLKGCIFEGRAIVCKVAQLRQGEQQQNPNQMYQQTPSQTNLF